MESLLQTSELTFILFGKSVSFNPTLLTMTWIIIGILFLIGWIGTRRLSTIPGTFQSILELVYEFIEDICKSSLGEKEGQKFIPFILALFLFILFSNWIGIIPNIGAFLGMIIALIYKLFGSTNVHVTVESLFNIQISVSETVWYSKLVGLRGLEEPTRVLGTDLALAIIVFFVAQINGIRSHGIINYAKNYMGIVPAKMPYTLFFFLNPFFYLEIISKVSGVVSHAFRLFGNIFGGGMIIALVSGLVHFLVVPIGLFGFFGIFAGIVQAFVFTMLAVTYIAQEQ